MLNLSRRAVLTGGALLGTVAIALPTLAAGSGTPANKAVAAGSVLERVGTDTPVALMSATLKTSKPTDLLMQVSLECSILTNLVLEDDGTGSVTQQASGAVRVWIQDSAGEIVPITSTSNPPQEGASEEVARKVTFCDRTHRRSITSQGESAPVGDGVDDETDYQRTKSANAFNWVLLNAGSGVETYTVMAEFDRTGVDDADAPTTTGSEAFVGNRTFIIEPTKMANDAVVGPEGSS